MSDGLTGWLTLALLVAIAALAMLPPSRRG